MRLDSQALLEQKTQSAIARTLVTKIAVWGRWFRATSLGEFLVAFAVRGSVGALFFGLVLSAMQTFAQPVDAVWVGGAAANNWGNAANWTTATAPQNPGDTASFNTSTFTMPTLIGGGRVNRLDYIQPGRERLYHCEPSSFFQLSGAGIINNSGVAQTINNSALLQFSGNSTAGNATINNSNFLRFFENSTAGNATINNSLFLDFFRIQLPETRRSTTRLG